jgi:hypothetical protein
VTTIPENLRQISSLPAKYSHGRGRLRRRWQVERIEEEKS